jgi:adenylate cyclase
MCKYTVKLTDYPDSATIACSKCNYNNTLEEHSFYLPKLRVLQGDEVGKEFHIRGKSTLGRSQLNTINITERKASRSHAMIYYFTDNYVIEDLKSGNGTFVNGNAISISPIVDNDKIQIGDTIFLFRNPYKYVPNADMSPLYYQSKHKVVSRESSICERTQGELKFDASTSFLSNDEQIQNLIDLGKANSKLRILNEISQAISSILDLPTLLSKIIDVVFQYMPAERGAILLYDEQTNTLKNEVIKMRNKSQEENIHISRTILSRVVEERISIWTTDALLDDRLSISSSIIAGNIRSAMSVPICYKDKLLGVLYIDSTETLTEFNLDSLELFSAIAMQAAICLENAQLLQRIERETETRTHLQRYLSPELVEQVVQKQITWKVGGEVKKATILFSDLRNFTKMTENIGAEAVVQILNNYFTRMVDIIFAHNGVLDKFIGDSIMGLWGIPVSHPQDTLNALRAAVAMQKELFYFNITQTKKSQNTLKMGIGINVGEVVVGNIGSPKRMEYTVVGPPVNLASRVESLTKRNQILISDNVFPEVRKGAILIPLEKANVKGIERAIQIYHVLGIKKTKLENSIFFLPILLWDESSKVYSWGGLIQQYHRNIMQLHIEPNMPIQKGDTIQFILDIPDVTPMDEIIGICERMEHIECPSKIENENDSYINVTISCKNISKPIQRLLKEL